MQLASHFYPVTVFKPDFYYGLVRHFMAAPSQMEFILTEQFHVQK